MKVLELKKVFCLTAVWAAFRVFAVVIAVDEAEPEAAGAKVSIAENGDVRVWATNAISTVTLSWKADFAPTAKVLGDAWERTYGDTYWRGICEKRDMPWYFLLSEDGRTEGWGVETQPNALAMWRASTNRVELVIDVRAGGRPAELKGRTLEAVRIVRGKSAAGESAWDFGRRFCKMMCPRPRLPKEPVYGYNDWYCAYGKNTATNFLADATMIVSLCEGLKVRPYVVMDDGWQKNSPPVVGESGRGPWDRASENFGMAMPEFAARVAALGAKPGLWYRPLRVWDEVAPEERLKMDGRFFDPSVASVRARILADMRRFREWGFKLVKIDFLTYDICGIWPCDLKDDQSRLIRDEREWRDRSRTTAEVMKDLYRAMREGAGDDVVIIGCNALNHLAAGLFEVQRTGNDTSGKDWNWTRNHGVNTLAMRSIQNGAFFKIDADCVGLAEENAVPWELNRQWMDLLGRSGTPFFVSWRRQLVDSDVREALSKAFLSASENRSVAEPLDWMQDRTPVRWRLSDGKTTVYDWKL